MKTKGELTREMIIARSARVFNQRGYSGTSIADLVAETKLERGGIYNHFRNKDELALAAFDYATSIRGQRIKKRLQTVTNSADKLIAMAEVFLEMLENPDLPGGCPILNTAAEADDTHPALKAHAQAALKALESKIESIVEDGIARGEIKPATQPLTIATFMLANLEGGMMMSGLFDDSRYLREVVSYLTHHINRELRL